MSRSSGIWWALIPLSAEAPGLDHRGAPSSVILSKWPAIWPAAAAVACRQEIGDRTPGDEVTYPHADLMAVLRDGRYAFVHKDGTPY